MGSLSCSQTPMRDKLGIKSVNVMKRIEPHLKNRLLRELRNEFGLLGT